jgi:hypothetical protein
MEDFFMLFLGLAGFVLLVWYAKAASRLVDGQRRREPKP